MNLHQRVPRYIEVAQQLAAAISGERYAVGAKLPTEAVLCQEFRISRYTAREALRQLRESGLISRRRGAGTTVEAALPSRMFQQSLASMDDITQYAKDTRLRIERRTTIVPQGTIADLLITRGGDPWVKLSAVRERPGDAHWVCLTTVYLSPLVAHVADALPTITGPIHALIEASAGLTIARVEQSVHATALTATQARKLHAAAGAPALRIVRRYIDRAGRTVEVSESIHPGDRYAYTMTLQRD